MWVIGGVVAGILFGPSRKAEGKNKIITNQSRMVDVPVEHETDANQFCIACGTEFPINDQFCPQCGTAGTNKSVPN